MKQKLLIKTFQMLLTLFFCVEVNAQEPYAILSEKNTVLTFYYDNQKSVRKGMDIGPFGHNDACWDGHAADIVKVVFDESFSNCTTLTSTAYLFHDCSKLTTIEGISNLNTANVSNMESMFLGCSSLTSIDVSHFDTSNVTDMTNMFALCRSLTSLDVSHFNTSKVRGMAYMFGSCRSLTVLDVSHFDTSNVIAMNGLFDGCESLTSIDVSQFDTKKVTGMGRMFGNCKSLTSVDVSHFDTSNVTSMGAMFEFCVSLPSIDVSGFNTSKVVNLGNMFFACLSLKSVDVSHFDTSKAWYLSRMFYGCPLLTSLDLSSFKTSEVEDMQNMFYECTALKTIYVGKGWTVEKVTNGGAMFEGCKSLVGGMGTAYTSEHVDYAYARVDGGSESPGYLTLKDTDVAIDAAHFPDEAFLNYLVVEKLSTNDVITFAILDLSGLGIKDMTGIGYFTALTELNICRNKISGKAMDALITSLRPYVSQSSVVRRVNEVPFKLYVLDSTSDKEGNAMTEAQAAAAVAKGWQPYYNNGTEWVAYSGGTPSGIESVVVSGDKSAPIYNLRGQRLSAPQKGINIINGKKVVVK